MELNTDVLVAENEIIHLIPHRNPFVMVDKLVFSDEKKAISTFKVLEDNIFIENEVLTEPALIENIAQTAALKIGYPVYLASREGQPAKAHLGFIGAITSLRVHQLPPIGAELRTEVIFENEVLDVFLFGGAAYYKNECLAECKMKIFVKRK